MAQKWADLVPGINLKTIQGENSFFDLGGHSLLAQQFLLTIRRELGTKVSINALYQDSTLAGFSAQVDIAKGGAGAAKEVGVPNYAKSLDELTGPWPRSTSQPIQRPLLPPTA